jgi:hypothetical protein
VKSDCVARIEKRVALRVDLVTGEEGYVGIVVRWLTGNYGYRRYKSGEFGCRHGLSIERMTR